MFKRILFVTLIATTFFACDTTKKTTSTASTVKTPPPPPPPPVPEPTPSTGTTDNVSGKNDMPADTLPIYRATPTLTNDIIHTKLDVRFDWAKQYMYGKAWISAKPYFYPTNTMSLDAKNFTINKVTMEGSSTPLKYTYDNSKLNIDLGRTFTRDEKYTVYIDYIAKPSEGEHGGSAAITKDNGLFFINPDGKDPDKPQQIWTQGETESNSRWFPTFDKPNERMTDEIYITTENKYKTLSNGLLKDQKNNPDGTRTDHWVMDMPHAPYLVMMAVGDFVIEKDKWRDKEILYYLEPKYAGKGKLIYKNVPEILEFYSKRLGVDYPWQKLAHIVVRDYVSGAMENTTAIVYGDFMNGDERSLIDKDFNETVVAHEMFHQWFGDLVTAENWSNLTVNESFADFSEGLWLEHKYGQETGDAHRKEVLDGYLQQAGGEMHPLVNFQYQDREKMFDAHSYNKGGLILHMLRHELGDDAFFAGLKKYLTDNAYKTGEAPQLRLAMEAVSGRDMNWFFNQWYYKAGHPVLDITYDYDAVNKKMNVNIKQIQERLETVPYVFELPLDIDIYSSEGVAPVRNTVRMIKRNQTFTFDAPTKPAVVDVDGDRNLLIQKADHHTDAEFAFLYNNSKRYLTHFEAMESLKDEKADKTLAQAVFKKAINDNYWQLREDALTNLININEDAPLLDKISKLAESDPRSNVRAKALDRLAKTKNAKFSSTFRTAMEKDPSNRVSGAAMKALYKIDSVSALQSAKKLENSDDPQILESIASMYAKTAQPEQLPFFERGLKKMDGEATMSFMGSYLAALDKAKVTDMMERMGRLKDLAIDQTQSPWRRFASAGGISKVRQQFKGQAGSEYADLTKMLSQIAEKETNEQIKGAIMNMIAK